MADGIGGLTFGCASAHSRSPKTSNHPATSDPFRRAFAGSRPADAQPKVKPPMPSAIYVDVLVYRRRQTHANGTRTMAGPKRLFVFVAMAYLAPGEPTAQLLWADTRDD